MCGVAINTEHYKLFTVQCSLSMVSMKPVLVFISCLFCFDSFHFTPAGRPACHVFILYLVYLELFIFVSKVVAVIILQSFTLL